MDGTHNDDAGDPAEVIIGGGEMGALLRAKDWSATPIGPVASWPQSLRTALSILLSSRHPMFLWWGPELVQFYNDGYRPSLGAHKHPQALGQRGRECWEEIWPIIGPQIDGVMARGQETWHEDQLVPFDRNGYLEEIYFTYSYSPIRDESGGVGGVLVVCTETTRRVIGERRLRMLRELAAQAAEAKTTEAACAIAASTLATNSSDIPFALLYLLDAGGNQARLMGTAGLAPGTTASPPTVDLGAPTAESTGWPLARAARMGWIELVSDLHTRFGPLPGGPWPEAPHSALILLIASPGQERPAGLLVVGISPRRALDDDYRGFLDLVAGHIASALSNARAYEAERRRAEALAELDRAKTAFFSNVSHEFRTPLTLLLGPLEDLLGRHSGDLQPEQREQVEIAHRSGLRLLKLVNTLLDFSRIEAGRAEVVYQPTDLAAFTGELASVFRSAVEQAGMRLRVDCPALPQPVYIDREMWEKIVLNLLSNAFKFTFAGEIAVTLRSVGDHIELEVRDTGVGIAQGELPRLFERFYRVRGSRARTYEGSGIGLALVRELVQLHGGSIGVASALDQGTTFTVSLPTGTAHLPADRLGPATAQASSAPTPAPTLRGSAPYAEEALRWLPHENKEQRTKNKERKGVLHTLPAADRRPPTTGEEGVKGRKGEGERPSHPFTPSPLHPLSPSPSLGGRVLLADDNADMRDYVRRLLGRHYEVEAVADGAAALRAARERVPDLVLADVMMPGMDGFELLRELRADPRTSTVPIVMLSARAGEEAAVEGMEAGADDYLVKPFSARELLARVGAHVKLARAREQVASILGSITDGFMAFDREWRFTYLNPEGARSLGRPVEELLGKNVWEEFPELAGSSFGQLYRQAVAGGVPLELEDYYPPFEAWFAVRTYPSEAGLSLYFRDVTARKQAEEQQRFLAEVSAVLTSSLDYPNTLASLARAAVPFLADACVMYQLVGDATLRRVALAHADPQQEQAMRETQRFDIALDSDIPVARVVRSGTLEIDRHVPADIAEHIHADLAYQSVVRALGPQAYICAPLIARGRTLGALAFILTDPDRQYSAADVALAEEVARRAAIALDNTRLYQEAQDAIRIRDQFLSIAAHELKTPLTSLLGYTQALLRRSLREGTLNERDRRALQLIAEQSKRLGKLIDSLLDVARIQLGRLDIERRRLDLCVLARRLVEEAGPALDRHTLVFQCDAEPLVFEGDELHLEQVFQNLIQNAVKYSPDGGQVMVRAERRGDAACLSVGDQGIGIPVAALPNLFQRFFRAGNVSPLQISGMGIGLYVVKEIITLHGGEVQVESTEGAGSTFTVCLPLAEN